MNTKSAHTPEELAEAIIFPVTFTAKEKKEAAEQLNAARVKTQLEMSAIDRLTLERLQIKFKLEDINKQP